MQKVYLVCGVPGSGKTWVCSQLEDKFQYVRNDDHIGGDYPKEVYRAARSSEKPILADCPFGERHVRKLMAELGLEVEPLFIVEKPALIKERYEARDLKPIPQQHITRAINMKARAEEWDAVFGTCQEILAHLREVALASR